MTRLTKLASLTLAAAALAPGAALAASADAPNELRGAPQMRVVDTRTVTVSFATDERLTAADPRVVVTDHGTATERAIKADGRHGDDFKYVARVKLRKEMAVGKKFRVRFAIADGEIVERYVVLKPKR